MFRLPAVEQTPAPFFLRFSFCFLFFFAVACDDEPQRLIGARRFCLLARFSSRSYAPVAIPFVLELSFF